MTSPAIEDWFEQLNQWHRERKHDQVSVLEQLLLTTPEALWSCPNQAITKRALPMWFDACLRLYLHYRNDVPQRAYSFVQLAYGRLQQLAGDASCEIAIRHWATQRIQHLAVLSLEFCQQQNSEQWRKESQQLIDNHVLFMQKLAWNEVRNDDQGSVQHH
ncbi:transcriptional regulator [Vibrio sp. JPW-9-11-11]|uniref:transcriptional regulator n=1 Tax=Vibrio sp. JPW-9-11-11 TaxID=1416532 RepID=UPI001594DBDE|nr:transcriptional regulator [Vibrio sp. JPW-9-11-11]NVD08627.1 transcriptional regulator [Vibrio sp. JPW-9-11-11]